MNMIKSINELDLSKLPEVEGCHFANEPIGTDCDPHLIVRKTPKGIKTIKLIAEVVESDGQYGGRCKYGYFYDTDDLENPDYWMSFRKSKTEPNTYNKSWTYVHICETPCYYRDPSF